MLFLLKTKYMFEFLVFVGEHVTPLFAITGLAVILYIFFFRGGHDQVYVMMWFARRTYKKYVLKDGRTYDFFVKQVEANNSFVAYNTTDSAESIQRKLNRAASVLADVMDYLQNYEFLVRRYFECESFTYKQFKQFKEDVKATNYKNYIIQTDAYIAKLKNAETALLVEDTETAEHVLHTMLVNPLNNEQFQMLAECANKYNIFTKEVSAEELEFTFNCQTSKLAEILRPRINRKLAVFLDTLDKGDIIINDWQSFVEKHKLFYSSDTSTQKHIMGRDLASALYKSGIVDSSKKDKYTELRSGVGEYIKQLKEM